ncbi:MAG: SIS domain-containing protein [Rhodothermaceae bacterium]|nr:SIS domain-containing protein [Rhodothermaceae bacterium]
MNAAGRYLQKANAVIQQIIETQMDALEEAASICAHSIGNESLVHLFASGHSRILVEEMFPRHGSFPGFHPMVELSLTYHNVVVGSNGQRQAMYLEHVEGLGQMILRNFVFRPNDSFIVFSNSGKTGVVVEVALRAKEMGLPVICVVSKEHCEYASPRHSSGKKLIDVADVVLDNCAPGGDAMVNIEGLDDPVGPGSTVGGAAIVNALKSLVAEKLTAMGKPPIVLTSSYFIGSEASEERFDVCYDDYRRRMKKVFGKD